jgi:RNA polymerase sigma-70 factor (ECF subfamily)
MTSAPSVRARETLRLDQRMLLKRHADGDSEAFAELVAEFRGPVYGYLLRTGMDAATCDDLFQEIFLKIHRSAHTHQPDRPLKPWIFTVAANTVRSYFRKKKIPVVPEEHAPLEGLPDDELDSGQAVVEAKETAAWLEENLRKLPTMQRQVVILCCIEHMAQKDVAEVLELPVNTVKTHLRRARITLARSLARRKARGSREVAS